MLKIQFNTKKKCPKIFIFPRFGHSPQSATQNMHRSEIEPGLTTWQMDVLTTEPSTLLLDGPNQQMDCRLSEVYVLLKMQSYAKKKS